MTNYFTDLADLLAQEQAHDRAQHESILFGGSITSRREQGLSWFPIVIGQAELGRGDYLTVTISRPSHQDVGHKFRFGMPVSLFSNHDPSVDRINGLIAFVSRDTMRIALRVDELPDWARRGKLGVDLLFDENAYQEMHQALRRAQQLQQEHSPQGQFIRQLIGEASLSAIPAVVEVPFQQAALNSSQQQAIAHVLSAEPISIVHGPPGTGKTTTLIHAVEALLQQEKQQILVVAPSNTAVDLLTERLHQKGISVLRMGNPVRVSDQVQQLTLDAQLERHPANKDIKNLQKQARAYMDMAQKYKRSFGKAERDQRKALQSEAHKVRKEVDKIQDYMVEDILQHAQVIAATLVGANHYAIRQRSYKTVIIDEAAQALEPACWIPLLKAEKVVLAGDHCQLPPTVKSSAQAFSGLYVTLFEKLLQRHPQTVSLLNTQYRMHTQIMAFPSLKFYDNALLAAAAVANHSLRGDGGAALQFIDTAGAAFEESNDDGAISNSGEAAFLLMHLQELLQDITRQDPESTDRPSVGLMSPYRRQSVVLKERLAADEQLQQLHPSIQVHTIDSFQGQEKDVIYISLTRSNAQQVIGFLSDVRRMNVAMTRARKKLVVIGDSSTVGKHPFYHEFLDYVERLGSYHSVWEWDISGLHH